MTYHWQCFNLGPNKRFGTDYVILAQNAAGITHKRTFSYCPELTTEYDIVFHIRALIRGIEADIEAGRWV